MVLHGKRCSVLIDRSSHIFTKTMRRLCLGMCFLCSFWTSASFSATESHGISIFGDLKYPKDFTHFDYVNPNAPKGGTVRMGAIGTFDSVNPFILKGVSAFGSDELIFDTLLEKAADEASAEYGLIAESVILSPNKDAITFTLRQEARWHDGSPITADDVVFSFETLKEKGHPHYASYYHDVASAESLDEHRVKFTFKNNKNRELPLIIGQLPIISKAYFSTHSFEQTTLNAPLGNGPYQIKKIDQGRQIIYERVKDYWGKNLPVNKGRFNFDTIQVDYYRDSVVAVEAFKAGEYDFRRENISKVWANSYQGKNFDNGSIIKEELPDGTPTGMQAFVMNTRRTPFDNRQFRKALNYAYNFEWSNEQLFYGAYQRNSSFFGNSDYASSGLPDEDELALLTPFRDSLPKKIFTEAYTPPTSPDIQSYRKNLIRARDILKNAGFFLRDMQLINPENNTPVEIEFLLVSPNFERVVAPFIRDLKKLGITATMRTVDASQYIKRTETFDYDVIVHWFRQSASPGNEQRDYWHSDTADNKGSRNFIGIKNPAVDTMVETLINADSKEDHITAAHALDRILLWNYYVIPQWYSRTHRVVYWDIFGRPQTIPPYSLGFPDMWWYKEKEE